jgi:hypothetical protein
VLLGNAFKMVVGDIAALALPVVLTVLLVVGMVSYLRRKPPTVGRPYPGTSATPKPVATRRSPTSMRVARPMLEDGETKEFEAVASHLKGDRKIVGRLTITDKRVIFTAARFYFLTRGNSRDIERSSITGIQLLPPGYEAMKQHGLMALKQPQIEVRYGDNMVYLVVRHPHEVVRILNSGDKSDRK